MPGSWVSCPSTRPLSGSVTNGIKFPLRNVTINGSRYDRVFGGSVPAPIWAEFMEIVLEGVEPLEFPQVTEEELEPYVVPPTTTVPYLIGVAEAEAVLQATTAKLTPRIQPIPSLQPAGTVVFQSIRGGATVEVGIPLTPVDLNRPTAGGSDAGRRRPDVA